MARKKLEQLINKRKGLVADLDTATTNEALDKVEMDLRKVDIQIRNAEKEVDEEERDKGNDPEVTQRTAAVNGDGVSNPEGEDITKRNANYVPGVGFRKVDETGLGNEEVTMRKVGNEMVSEKELEKRGDIWKGKNVETRSVVLDETILIPEHKASQIAKQPFNEVSSILDLVKITPFKNGETYEVPFEYETGIADYTDEPNVDGTGGEYNEVEVKFDNAKVRKAFITSYAEISKQFKNTPSANYAERVQANVIGSIRKKLARDIIIGTGGDNAIQGILTQPAELENGDKGVKKPNRTIDKDIEVSELGVNTINDIVFNYGGDNDVEEGQVLLMNKLTLNEFAKMRDGNGNKVYNIKTFGATFTIDDIRGVFSAYIKPFNKASENEYFMAYGSPQAYELALFSALEVEESIHHKFKQGMISYRGDEAVGGNLTAYKSWVRVKKVAAAPSELQKEVKATKAVKSAKVHEVQGDE